MDSEVYISPECISDKKEDYVYNRLLLYAQMNNIDDIDEVNHWYSVFSSFVADEMDNRIETGDYNHIDIEESISTMEYILSRRYG